MNTVKHLSILSVLLIFAFPSNTTQAQGYTLVEKLLFDAPVEHLRQLNWGGGPPETIHLDTVITNNGRGAVRIERTRESSGAFTALTMKIPLDVAGDRIELKGFLRTEAVTGFAGLWMRQDGNGGMVQFDNMQRVGLKGTTEWKEYSIQLPNDPNGQDLFFGVLMGGEGKVWADDLQLLVDGQPFEEVEKREIELTILDTDTEFDSGSGITVASLTDQQTEHLAVLGKVWGFMKYHHPAIAEGTLHWDYELFRVLPSILDANSEETRNKALELWIEGLGIPDTCDPCANPAEDVHLLPELDWIRNNQWVSENVSTLLQQVYDNRFAGKEHFHIGMTIGAGNPIFKNEKDYGEMKEEDAGLRILALYRMWNIIEYWFPYRNQIDDDWDATLKEFLPRIVAATNSDTYRLELLAFLSRIKDTHVNLRGAFDVLPPKGECLLPVGIRFIENKPIVVYKDEAPEKDSGLLIGDVIEAIDGQGVNQLIKEWSPYHSASNEPALLRNIAWFITRGNCGEVALTVDRNGSREDILDTRVAGSLTRFTHDRPGDTFQLLSPEVAYIKLSSIKSNNLNDYLEAAKNTKGLIIDIRNYPSEFVVFSLGSRLITERTPFVRFTTGEIHNPGAFTWNQPLYLQPANEAYKGKVAILVDISSISQSEYTSMAFRSSPNAVVIGSTTAGADGNVSPIVLPGKLGSGISGIGVFYPDKTPTQRIGIVADIESSPTIEGIRQGRDEVMETAIRHILGEEADEATIIAMAKPRI